MQVCVIWAWDETWDKKWDILYSICLKYTETRVIRQVTTWLIVSSGHFCAFHVIFIPLDYFFPIPKLKVDCTRHNVLFIFRVLFNLNKTQTINYYVCRMWTNSHNILQWKENDMKSTKMTTGLLSYLWYKSRVMLIPGMHIFATYIFESVCEIKLVGVSIWIGRAFKHRLRGQGFDSWWGKFYSSNLQFHYHSIFDLFKWQSLHSFVLVGEGAKWTTQLPHCW